MIWHYFTFEQTQNVNVEEYAALCNTRGFAALPVELLLHILSYMQEAAIPSWNHECPMHSCYREKRTVLRALCQLCRSLRTALLPLLWERLEACAFIAFPEGQDGGDDDDDDVKPRALAKELLGQLKLVANAKKLYAPYVRIVNVAIEPKFANAVLTKLARALKLLPNLHTVQIICSGPLQTEITFPHFQKAFRVARLVFPSVKRIILPYQARGILSCFPEVLDVFLNHQLVPFFNNFIKDVARHCRKVQSIGWIECSHHQRTATIVEKLPNIRRVEYYMTSYQQAEMVQLSALKNLEQIRLVRRFVPERVDRAAPLIDAARKVLAGSSRPNRRLDMMFLDTGETRTITFDNV